MEEKNNISNNLDAQFISSNLSSLSYQGAPIKYSGSEKQKQLYESVLSEDAQFKTYIEKTYGTYDAYKKKKNVSFSSEFDPSTDYIVDVSVIGEDRSVYSSDHISADEVVIELLTGVCTFYYVKVNGASGKSMGSLNMTYLPDDQYYTRRNFFSPLPGDRIVLWDISKQKWNSFYMSRLIKFIRDEKSDLQ